jgi:isoamylase
MVRMDISDAPVVDGPHWDGTATTFVVSSRYAEAIELAIFDGDGNEHRHELERISDRRHAIRLESAGPGTRYGFRVHGPWNPHAGHRFNARKLLTDPYARSLEGSIEPSPALAGHELSDPTQPSHLDSAPHMLRSVVHHDEFDWQGVRRPQRSLADTVIYETHVRGISKLHPAVPQELRGTYAGLTHEAVLEHLVGLGITAVELLPVHHFVQDQHLLHAGRRNYWGYNTIGFFAPHAGYAATDDPVVEFKTMVRELHRAGLEVILDVVYNHTAEGNHHGPTLCFRGLDNRSWYRLDPSDQARYLNWTGTGNVVDFGQQSAITLTMDSLRYWVEEMGVDGFRFDLATVLGRTHEAFDSLGGFLGAAGQDPTLRTAKLIAEPWDVGPGGYQVGNFPDGWSEWNDQFRDVVRDYWRGAEGKIGVFASRITGSSDMFEASGRSPLGSVNYVTSHDGYTLGDLVSYEKRHNHANGENNQDGHRDNRSWNSGVEGPTTRQKIVELRARRSKSILTTLLLSQGIPMVLGGDEIGRTQRGNNNAYNQDNEISWYDWSDPDDDMHEYVKKAIELRRDHPTFRRTAWLHEHAVPGEDLVGWYTPAGMEMTSSDWETPHSRSIALYLAGESVHMGSSAVTDDDFLMLFNAHEAPVDFSFPKGITTPWSIALDSSGVARLLPRRTGISVPEHTVVVLCKTCAHR